MLSIIPAFRADSLTRIKRGPITIIPFTSTVVLKTIFKEKKPNRFESPAMTPEAPNAINLLPPEPGRVRLDDYFSCCLNTFLSFDFLMEVRESADLSLPYPSGRRFGPSLNLRFSPG